MLENWVWQSQVLHRLSVHVETKEPLPDTLLKSLIKAKHVNVALNSLRQIELSTLDMRIHGDDIPTTVDQVLALQHALCRDISLSHCPTGCTILRSFGHLMNQYSASYYGYLWAEVLSADLFTRFEEEGVFNAKTGMEYRKSVLAPGGEKLASVSCCH